MTAGTSAGATRRAGPDVRLAAGDEESGLASMLASLLEDNLRDFRTRSLAARLTRGDVVLLARDRDLAVTLSFRPGEVVVGDGSKPGAPVLAGAWLDMARICSGQRSPIAAVASGELQVSVTRGMRAAIGAGVALSVPKSFYEEDRERLRRRRRAVVVSVTLVAVVVLAGVVARERRAPRRGRRGARGTEEAREDAP